MKKVFGVVVAVIFVFTFAHLVLAMDMSGDNTMNMTQPNTTENPAQKTEAVNVGNKICPVSGEKIEEAAKATYEYNGKIYNFCCSMCIDAFKQDPEKYIKKIEEELKAENKESVEGSRKVVPKSETSEDAQAHEGHHH